MAARDSDPERADNWMHDLYDHHPIAASSSVLDPTTIATTTIAPPALQPEGRVAKPARRRSRASRKAPTTLVNTDPTNFRAMVQQFTGVANPPTISTVYQPSAVYGNGAGMFRMDQAPHDRPVETPFGGPRQPGVHDVAAGYLQGFNGGHSVDGNMSNNAWF